MVSHNTARGFAKLPNLLTANGILAHLRASAFKVLGAILLATRTKTGTCYPGVKTLARWSGVAEKRISAETDYLEQHRLIHKKRIRMGNNKVRILYRVVYPSDPEYPDYRYGCPICDGVEPRRNRVVRDPVTGRLQGTRPRPESPDRRSPETPDDRSSNMTPDDRRTNQTESDEETPTRRGGGVRVLGTSSPRPAEGRARPANGNSGPSPRVNRPLTSTAAADVRQAKRLESLRTLSQNSTMTTVAKLEFAKKAKYTRAEITQVFGASMTDMDGDAISSTPPGSPISSGAIAGSSAAAGGVA